MTAREPRPELADATGGGVTETPLWRHARSRRVRELAWCTLSPQLFSQLPDLDGAGRAAPARLPAPVVADWQRWLTGADPAVTPPTIDELAAGLDPVQDGPARSLRLGRHAERLLQFALQRMDGVRLMASNLPVRRASGRGVQTLGELDFVWEDLASGEVVHWEMAAKFYLLVEPPSLANDVLGSDGEAWRRAFVGPNLVDRLGDKLDHIVRHQLALSSTPEAQVLLGRPMDRSEIYLLGWLFYRDSVMPAAVTALGLAADHLRGWWSTLDGWAARMRQGPDVLPRESDRADTVRWCRLPRSAWMAPAVVGEADTEDMASLYTALAERFSDLREDRGWRRETPVMVCELVPAGLGAPGMWRERSRGFVVPPDWEARARRHVEDTASHLRTRHPAR